MAENPLLPDRRLRELHELMMRCRKLCHRPGLHSGLPREALLAATAIHLLPGDLLCGEPGDTAAGALGPQHGPQSGPQHADVAAPALQGASHLSLCAAMARGLQAAGQSGVAVALLGTQGKRTGWPESLAWAVARQLPLIAVCTDALNGPKPRAAAPRGTTRPGPALTWPEMSRVAKRLPLPLFSVDGEDAVAVYRVIQEAVLRARSGGGPAVLWAVLGAETAGEPLGPIPRLRRYMAARGIPLTG